MHHLAVQSRGKVNNPLQIHCATSGNLKQTELDDLHKANPVV